MEEKQYASDIAGHCNEPTAWKILKEGSQQIIEHKQLIINPFFIEIKEDVHFALSPTEIHPSGFDAPEVATSHHTEASVVWSLGATIFYVVMGRQVMNNKGGAGQTETSKLPYMRSEWPELSELVQQCLRFHPSQRPSLQQILDKASEQHDRCMEEISRGPKFKKNSENAIDGTINATDEIAFWPESMHETQVINQKNKTRL